MSYDDDLTDADIDRARALLPAWFVPRMMGDSWCFALVTSQEQAFVIETITDVQQAKDGTIWLDVDLLDRENLWLEGLHRMGLKVIAAPTSRVHASINAAHIVAAFEIADT